MPSYFELRIKVNTLAHAPHTRRTTRARRQPAAVYGEQRSQPSVNTLCRVRGWTEVSNWDRELERLSALPSHVSADRCLLFFWIMLRSREPF